MDNQACDDWCTHFENSTAGKRALQALDKYFPPHDQIIVSRQHRTLRNAVLHACYGAAMFDKDRDLESNKPIDPNQNAYKLDADAKKQLPLHKKAITSIQSFVKKHPKVAEVIFVQIFFDLYTRNVRITDKEKRNWVELMNCVLQVIESRLAKPINFETSWSPMQPRDYGCLRYDTPIYMGKFDHRPGVETMLLFDLVLMFRLLNLGLSINRYGTKMPQPNPAKKTQVPIYVLATKIVNAALRNRQIGNDTARNRIKYLGSKVSYIPWPALR